VRKTGAATLVAKRFVDLALSVLGLAVLWPFCVVLWAVVSLSSPGPAIFRQERAGRHGQTFMLYKFRTMFDRAPDGFVTAEDFRITRIGRLLRMLSLDEIPQLWNVIKGDMSLVGPRPDRVFRAKTYDDRIRQRLSVRPGIMGWAQLHDGRSMTWNERYEYDLEYVANWSFAQDLRIIWWSVIRGNMMQREGISRDGET